VAARMQTTAARFLSTALGQFWMLPRLPMALWLFTLGLGLRFAFILLSGLYREPINFTEMEKIAQSLATENLFGNPYKIPTGPTAHCAPMYPFLLSLIYRALGFGIAAKTASLLMNAVFASLTHALLPLLAEAAGLKRQIGLLAGLIGALIPFRLLTELEGWEAPLTALCMVSMVSATAHWYKRLPVAKIGSALYGMAWGLVFLAAPQLLFVFLILAIAPLFWMASRRRSALACVLIAALSAAAVVLPWTVRNYKRLGAVIFIRSNIGIELATSNFPGASEFATENLFSRGSESYHFKRHPYPSAAEAEVLKKMGEIKYNQWRITEAWNWAKSNPGEAVSLSIRRFFHFWFLPSKAPKYKDFILHPMVVLAFIGAWKLLRVSLPTGWLFASVFLGYPGAYYFIQLSTRYRYPMEWCFSFLSVAAFWAMAKGPEAMLATVRESDG